MQRIAWITVCLLLVPIAGHGAERFIATFMDESRLEADEVKDWCDPLANPTLAGRSLFEPQAPLRWLADRSQPPATSPAKFIEFVGGDRFAGEVTAYQDGLKDRFEPVPPHLIIKPLADLHPPDVTISAPIRVTTTWIRRIAWNSPGTREYRPGTIWLLAGTSIPFRSLRWTESGLIALTAEGVKQFSFSDLGEIHLPQIDPWSAYVEQLSILSPDAGTRLIQLDDQSGNRLTASFERFQARHLGEKNRPENWYQLLQPAWSLDPLWLRFRAIQSWMFYAPQDVPLSKFAPLKVQHQAVFGSSFGWQIDQSALRTPLRSLTQEFGWGWGVQGSSDLVFELPEMARAVRARYSLDRNVGEGGCVHIQLQRDDDLTIVDHRHLIGAEFVGDSHWIDLPVDLSKRHQITFRTEMAHEGRPAAADPYDIGDIVNWYEPEVRLDRQSLVDEVAKYRIGWLTGLAGWTVPSHEKSSWKTANVLDVSDSRDPRFRTVGRAEGPFYTLSRQFKIGPSDRWLTIVASQFAPKTTSGSLQVRIDGRVMAATSIPIRDSMSDPQPVLVSVEPFQGRTVPVELIVFPSDIDSWIDWRGLFVGPDRPGILTVFEDDPAFADLLKSGDGQIDVDNLEQYAGRRSLRVSSGTKANAQLIGLNAEIVEFPRLGQYRYVTFAWKKPSGTRIQLGFANHGRLDFPVPPAPDELSEILARQGLRRTQMPDPRGRRFGYRYEVGVATTQPPAPLWMSGEVPRDWRLVERDLFADFGSFVITGLTLNSRDEHAAWFDHLVLARTRQDLAWASLPVERSVHSSESNESPESSEALSLARHKHAVVEFSRIAPLFSPVTSSFQLKRIPEHRGQTDVLRTETGEGEESLTLRAGIELSGDRPVLLEVVVGHEPQQSWPLVVRANGEVLSETTINEARSTTGTDWTTIRVSLARFAGQKVVLEVAIPPTPGKSQVALWKNIGLVQP